MEFIGCSAKKLFLCIMLISLGATPALALNIYALDQGGSLYSLDTETLQAKNIYSDISLRNSHGLSMGIDGTLYTAISSRSSYRYPYRSKRYSIDPINLSSTYLSQPIIFGEMVNQGGGGIATDDQGNLYEVGFRDGKLVKAELSDDFTVTEYNRSNYHNFNALAWYNQDTLFAIGASSQYPGTLVEIDLSSGFFNFSPFSYSTPTFSGSNYVLAKNDLTIFEDTLFLAIENNIGSSLFSYDLTQGRDGLFSHIGDFSVGNIVGIAVDPASAAPVPEPATMFLLGSGMAGMIAYRRKTKH